MRAVKKKSSLYSFLDASGVLETGSEEEILKSKKLYYKEYKRIWRKEKRKTEKEFTLSFTNAELKQITEAARKHKMSLTKYIKRTTIWHMSQVYIVPDIVEVRRISQWLAMHFNLIQQMVEEEKLSSQFGNPLLKKIEEIEHQVLIHLCNPDTLEDWINREVKKNPDLKEKILRLLTTISSDGAQKSHT